MTGFGKEAGRNDVWSDGIGLALRLFNRVDGLFARARPRAPLERGKMVDPVASRCFHTTDLNIATEGESTESWLQREQPELLRTTAPEEHSLK